MFARVHGTPLQHLILLIAFALAFSACGRDYSSRMGDVLNAVHAHHPESALESVDQLIKRGESNKKPERSNLTLLLLERASIYQALGRHEDATRDLLAADQMLEILDLTPQGARNAAAFLFADNSRVYHAPIYEKLLVNVSALSSFLALGDYRAAAVEARRVFVLAEYFEGEGFHEHPILGAAYSLAGIALELAGDAAGARHAYRRSTEIHETPFNKEALELLQNPRRRADQEVIFIVLSGLGPTKVAQAFPVGVALGWLNDGTQLGQDENNIVAGLSAQELSSWVRFPVLVTNHAINPAWSLRTPQGPSVTLFQLTDVNAFAIAQWERARASIAWAAITRFLTRHVARQALSAGGQAVGGVGGSIMRMAGLVAQNAMLAADTPDTRAWNTIPAGIHVARVPVEPGLNRFHLEGVHGVGATTIDIEVDEGRTRVVTLRLFQ